MTEQLPLETLLLRYQQGDREAAGLLVVRSAPLLFRSVRPFVPDTDAAEEVLQEAWLRIHSSRHTWRAGEPALPWLLAVTRYTRIDYLRKRYRRREVEWEALPAEPAMADARTDELGALLEALPDSQREVVLMLKGEGLSLEETALAMGTTVGSVKQRASRAYAKLRAILEKGGALGATS